MSDIIISATAPADADWPQRCDRAAQRTQAGAATIGRGAGGEGRAALTSNKTTAPAQCQRCHLTYDAPLHARNRRANAARAAGQTLIPLAAPAHAP